MSDIAAKLAKRRKRELTADLCLDPNLAADYAEAEAELAEIEAARTTRKKNPTSLAGEDAPDGEEGRRAELKATLDRLADEITEMTVTFTFRALGSKRWDELLVGHPARRDESGSMVVTDKGIGINTASFFRAAIPESCTDPALSEKQWADILDEAGDADYNRLANAIWMLNTEPTSGPLGRAQARALGRAASKSLQGSAES